jgi:hypothetical protein
MGYLIRQIKPGDIFTISTPEGRKVRVEFMLQKGKGQALYVAIEADPEVRIDRTINPFPDKRRAS